MGVASRKINNFDWETGIRKPLISHICILYWPHSSRIFLHVLIDRLLVGAPLSNVTSAFGETLEKYGTVFKCEYKPNSKSCTEIAVDHRRKSVLMLAYLTILHQTCRHVKHCHYNNGSSASAQTWKQFLLNSEQFYGVFVIPTLSSWVIQSFYDCYLDFIPAASALAYLEKSGLNFSSSSFAIRFYQKGNKEEYINFEAYRYCISCL